MSNRRRPSVATQALMDQAEAASADALRVMHAVAGHFDTEVVYGRPGPVRLAIVARLVARLLLGQITLCPHLSLKSPTPAQWLAWAPGRLRCRECSYAAARRIKGTPEDRRCDHCRRVHDEINVCAALLPPRVAELPGGSQCLPPVQVQFGLCESCFALDAGEAL